MSAAECAALARHPNCVTLTGHEHIPFTATNAVTITDGSLRLTSGSTSACKGGGAQAAIVRVWENGLTIDKREVKSGDPIVPPTVLNFANGKFSLER